MFCEGNKHVIFQYKSMTQSERSALLYTNSLKSKKKKKWTTHFQPLPLIHNDNEPAGNGPGPVVL